MEVEFHGAGEVGQGLDDAVEALHLSGEDIDVALCSFAGTVACCGDFGAEEFEVNDHGVDGIFDFVAYAGGEFADGGQAPGDFEFLSELQGGLGIAQGEEGAEASGAALSVVDAVEGDLDLASVFQGDGLCDDGATAGEGLQYGCAEGGFGVEDLFDAEPDHVLLGVFGEVEEVCDGIGDHDGAVVGGEEQDAVAEGVEHLVEVGLEGGVSSLGGTNLLAEAVDGSGDADDGIVGFGAWTGEQRCGDAFGEGEVFEALADLFDGKESEIREKTGCDDGCETSETGEEERGFEPGGVGVAQEGGEYADVHDEEGLSVANEGLGTIEDAGFSEDLTGLVGDATIADGAETGAVRGLLIQSIGVGADEDDSVGIGDADVLHGGGVADDGVHDIGERGVAAEGIGDGGVEGFVGAVDGWLGSQACFDGLAGHEEDFVGENVVGGDGLFDALAEQFRDEEGGEDEYDGTGQGRERQHQLGLELHRLLRHSGGIRVFLQLVLEGFRTDT